MYLVHTSNTVVRKKTRNNIFCCFYIFIDQLHGGKDQLLTIAIVFSSVSFECGIVYSTIHMLLWNLSTSTPTCLILGYLLGYLEIIFYNLSPHTIQHRHSITKHINILQSFIGNHMFYKTWYHNHYLQKLFLIRQFFWIFFQMWQGFIETPYLIVFEAM